MTEHPNTMPKHICPNCKSERFIVNAHVVQEWVVDTHGNYDYTSNECTETLHTPDDDDIWTCHDCGYSGAGKLFVVPEPNKTPSDDMETNCITAATETLVNLAQYYANSCEETKSIECSNLIAKLQTLKGETPCKKTTTG